MNVCLLNDSFPPVIDGVANVVFNYAKIINEKYGQSTVITPQYPDVVDNYDFPVYRYPSINTTKFVGYRTGYPFNLSVLRRAKRRDIDLVHLHCPFVSAMYARTLREIIHVPIVFTYHTKYDIDIAKIVSSEHIQNTAAKYIINNIEACDDVWVVSKGAGENLKSLGYTGDYLVMENGVDFPRGRVLPEEEQKLRDLHGLPQSTAVYLFVGRLMWYKGIRIILDGLKLLKERHGTFKMIFVGDGTDRAEIESYASDIGLASECIFTGAIRDRQLLRAYFCLADLFLFPSTFDTNGIVVREAASCGLASVLIAGSAAGEGVLDRRNGLLIDESSEGLAGVLAGAGQDKSLLKEVGMRAMDELYISWEDSVAKAYDRYEIVRQNYRGHKHLSK